MTRRTLTQSDMDRIARPLIESAHPREMRPFNRVAAIALLLWALALYSLFAFLRPVAATPAPAPAERSLLPVEFCDSRYAEECIPR